MNSLRLRRTTAGDLCSSATVDDNDDGALAERYRLAVINNVRSKSATTVMFIMATIHLKTISHHDDVNEVSCQFIALSMF